MAAPEAYEAAAREQRSFTAPMDSSDTEGIEPAVPLRSKMWFNNPEDGESSACIYWTTKPMALVEPDDGGVGDGANA